MKEFFKDITGDKTAFLGLLATFVLTILSIIFIFFVYPSLPPYIPIFNQLPWGDQRLGQTQAIFIPVIAAVIIFFFNVSLSKFIYRKIPLAARMLIMTSLIVTIIAFLFIAKTANLIL